MKSFKVYHLKQKGPSHYYTKVKPNISLVEVHPQLDNNGHLEDGALVGWFTMVQNSYSNFKSKAPNVKTRFSFLSNKVFQSKDVLDITNADSRTSR